MAEEWLRALAQQIKHRDHDAAEQFARQRHVQEIVAEHGPVFWRSFADFLAKYVDEIKADFHEDITLREGPLTFSFTNNQISIKKAAFPFVEFNATPQFQNGGVGITYRVNNPQQTVAGRAAMSMPCRLEVSQDNKVFLQLDGQPFQEPGQAAQHIMQKLFTIQD
jgi:hypothetical protein